MNHPIDRREHEPRIFPVHASDRLLDVVIHRAAVLLCQHIVFRRYGRDRRVVDIADALTEQAAKCQAIVADPSERKGPVPRHVDRVYFDPQLVEGRVAAALFRRLIIEQRLQRRMLA